MNNTIKVAIADDHPLIISSIENVLKEKEYFVICGRYHTGEELVNGLKENVPEVLILDYHLPDDNGAKLAKYITHYYPQVRILAISGYDKPGLSTEMIECGCSGFLLKTSARSNNLLEAIHTVFDNKLYFDSNLKQKFAENVNKQYRQKNKPKLTIRETEILTLIVHEFSSQEIADKLHISKKTVHNHRASILMKTGAKNNFALMKIAMEMRLI